MAAFIRCVCCSCGAAMCLPYTEWARRAAQALQSPPCRGPPPPARGLPHGMLTGVLDGAMFHGESCEYVLRSSVHSHTQETGVTQRAVLAALLLLLFTLSLGERMERSGLKAPPSRGYPRLPRRRLPSGGRLSQQTTTWMIGLCFPCLRAP